MPKYIAYEVWTKARIIYAKDERDAYKQSEPKPIDGLNLCNWHVKQINENDKEPASSQ